MTKRRTKIATLLSTSALVVLDAACPLYVIGGSGERGEARGRERHAAGAPGSASWQGSALQGGPSFGYLTCSPSSGYPALSHSSRPGA
jgi:hypothetical protein